MYRHLPELRNVRSRLYFDAKCGVAVVFLVILRQPFSDLRHRAADDVVRCGVVIGRASEDVYANIPLFEPVGVSVQSPLHHIPPNGSIALAISECGSGQNPLEVFLNTLAKFIVHGARRVVVPQGRGDGFFAKQLCSRIRSFRQKRIRLLRCSNFAASTPGTARS